mgnify:CR=1 FL=1
MKNRGNTTLNPRRRNRTADKPSRPAAKPKLDIAIGDDGVPLVEGWDTYRLLAVQTESTPKLWSEETHANLRMVHHVIGVVTELDELFPREEMLGLCQDNWVEELGDMLWYLACINTILVEQGFDENGEFSQTLGELLEVDSGQLMDFRTRSITTRGIQKFASEQLDAAKRLLAYGDGSLSEGDAMSLAWKAYYLVSDTVALVLRTTPTPVPMLEVAQANIAKLSKRYPEGFDATKAVNRQLEKEAEVFKRHKLSRQQAVRVRAEGETDASV